MLTNRASIGSIPKSQLRQVVRWERDKATERLRKELDQAFRQYAKIYDAEWAEKNASPSMCGRRIVPCTGLAVPSASRLIQHRPPTNLLLICASLGVL